MAIDRRSMIELGVQARGKLGQNRVEWKKDNKEIVPDTCRHEIGQETVDKDRTGRNVAPTSRLVFTSPSFSPSFRHAPVLSVLFVDFLSILFVLTDHRLSGPVSLSVCLSASSSPIIGDKWKSRQRSEQRHRTRSCSTCTVHSESKPSLSVACRSSWASLLSVQSLDPKERRKRGKKQKKEESVIFHCLSKTSNQEDRKSTRRE